MGALVEKLEHRRFCREAGGESKTRRAVFELSKGSLERGARRIPRARIFPTQVHTRGGLRERCGREDRRDDSASCRITFLPAVDCACRETNGL
jgi:hypothetical protein